MTDEPARGAPNGSDGVERRSVLKAVGAGVGLSAAAGVDEDSTLAGVLSGVSSSGSPGGEGLYDARVATTDPAGLVRNYTAGGQVRGKAECFRPNQREIYGPTDINAQSGNGRLSVAVNDAGTMTVFRWPYPSYYDQVKYFTTGRDAADEITVAPNAGAFLGVALDRGEGFETTWLRDLTVVEQAYASDRGDTDAAYSDEVVTVYTDEADPPLVVIVRDVVAQDVDAFVRNVRVTTGDADVEAAKLISYENVNPVVSKYPQYPVQDWCMEEDNGDLATYDAAADAIVHRKTGVDVSTQEPQSVAVAMGFAGDSSGHQVGGDAYEPAAAPVGQAGPLRDAYDDASDLPLSGNDSYAGQTTGALVTDLEFTGETATETVVFAAGHEPADATDVLETVRDRPFADVRATKEAWLQDLLGDAPLPDVDEDAAVDADVLLALCRRALVTLVTDTEATDDRAIVASIATQAPYGEDWPRDGAYFNYALELLGLEEWVDAHNRWYADIQQTLEDPRPSHPNTPPGNWIMNYYGDGVAGGPIPYEIDETGYGIWTLYQHHVHADDPSYLEAVYPAIERAADFLVECRDPEGTGLHCPTWEDDRFQPQRPTIVGAALVWLGLKAAAAAARDPDSLGTEADAARYETRQHEVGRGIDRHLYGDITGDGDVGYGTRIGFSMAEVVWPVAFTPYYDPDTESVQETPVTEFGDEPVETPFDHPRIRTHLDTTYRGIEPAFQAPDPTAPDTGQYEVKSVIPLAKARREDGPGSIEDLEAALEWIATRHATPDTHVMGEAWKVFDGADGEREVRSIVSQPHAWEQVLTYLAALEVYPPAGLEYDAGSVGGVLEALRSQ